MSKEILKFNNIAERGLTQLADYQVVDQCKDPSAIILRSHNLHEHDFADSLLAVGRAGAGVNNIPIDRLSEKGVVVFNTPGANANAVKEIVISAMLLSSRNLFDAHDFVKTLSGTDEELHKLTESNKKNFSGSELRGKTIGVVGLGAIGVLVANAANSLGMKVIGFDPAISIKNAWHLSSQVEQAEDLNYLYSQVDFLTFHVPLNKHTENLFSEEHLSNMRPGAVVMNFSRDGIVNTKAMVKGLEAKKIANYCTDFPKNELLACPGVIILPHLGASTQEAEENCAVMVCRQIKDYLENANITNAVNLPNVNHPRIPGSMRLAILNQNIPNMLAEISGKLGSSGVNISDMINKSRGNLAYTVVDAEREIPQDLVSDIKSIPGIIRVRCIA